MLSEMKNYKKISTSDVRLAASGKEDGCEKQLLVFQTPFDIGAWRNYSCLKAQGYFL